MKTTLAEALRYADIVEVGRSGDDKQNLLMVIRQRHERSDNQFELIVQDKPTIPPISAIWADREIDVDASGCAYFKKFDTSGYMVLFRFSMRTPWRPGIIKSLPVYGTN